MNNLIKIFLLLGGLLFFSDQNYILGQAQLVLGNTSAAYVVMSGGISGTPINLVIGDATSNAAPATITRLFSGAGIISEGEFNYVKWYTGSGTGTNYLIPWRDNTAPTTEDASVQFDITVGGTAGGFFLASTYDGVTDNDTYKPAPVTSMASGATGNASQWVMDRFWSLIDEASYPAKPTLENLTFTYVDNEHSANTGPITEGNMQAQRWNTGAGLGWQGLLFGSATNTVTNTQTTAALTAANLFRWWTLVDNSKPLPVQWLSFSAECNRGEVTVNWSTATEQNADFFTVERSLDGIAFHAIATKEAAGNSSTPKYYSVIDKDAYSGISYYRVKETDFNGSSIYSGTLAVHGCLGDVIVIYGANSGAVVDIHALADGQYSIEMYNALGQKLTEQLANVTAGNNHIKIYPDNVPSAIYVVKVFNSNLALTQRVFIRSIE